MAGNMSPAEVAAELHEHPGWEADGNASLKRTFKFADHITAMGFVTRVGMAAEALDHHPDLRIVYNRVEIVLTTHAAGGVTEKDFELAAKIDRYA